MWEDTFPNPQTYKTLLNTAIAAAQAPAADLLKRFAQIGLVVEDKGDGSPVTVADREAELKIREILKSDPLGQSYAILGEEHGLEGTNSRFRWLIDPIDGTRSFINGIPLFGTIVALEDMLKCQALIGVIHLPVQNLTYSAARGLGSACNATPISVSSETELEKSIISMGDIAQFYSAGRQEVLKWLMEHCSYLRGYTDCFGHSLVASGAVSAMFDPALNPWDVMATQVLVEEAGGKMVIRPSQVPEKLDVLFGSPAIVQQLVQLTNF